MKNYDLETTFSGKENEIMTVDYDASDRIKTVVNIKEGKITQLKDGYVIHSFNFGDSYEIELLEMLFTGTSKCAGDLKEFYDLNVAV